ncbi:MAG: hypothetical protein KGV44_08010 [Flavobacteriaceae bacterium]|nr:hypothetical protein [Flavobacteriaceae bacterium]
MDTNHYLHIINQPSEINDSDTKQLEEVIAKYPYFQSARAIYIKSLQRANSFKFNDALKKTASYTVDRRVLFEWIVNPLHFNQFSEEIPILNQSKISEESQEEIHEEIQEEENQNIEKTAEEQAKEVLKIGTPIPFSVAEPHSFNEWLQIAQKRPISDKKEEEKQEKSPKKDKKSEIIDRFIRLNPKIKPIKKEDTPINIPIDSALENKGIMTETLAKVYLEQKKYDKAIQAYKILSLKYPKKSGFFADQIRAIEVLQNK